MTYPKTLSLRSPTLQAALLILAAMNSTALAQRTIDFESVLLSADSSNEATGTNPPPIEINGVSLNQNWNDDFDCCPSGFAVSNRTDTTTAGFSNSFSAFTQTGGGFDGSSNYAIANNFSRGESTIDLDVPDRVFGMYVTNTTYAYLAIVDGNDGGANFVTPFADGDFYRLDIFGLDAGGNQTGQTDFFLADYRDGRTDAIDEWTFVDLTPLGNNVSQLEFSLTTTDIDPDFGFSNTPAYFAIDNLIVGAVPEPSSFVILMFAAVPVLSRRRRYRSI